MRIHPFEMLQIIFLSKQGINKKCILKFQFHSPLRFVWSHGSPLRDPLEHRSWCTKLGASLGPTASRCPCLVLRSFISLSSLTWTLWISLYCFMGMHISGPFIVCYNGILKASKSVNYIPVKGELKMEFNFTKVYIIVSAENCHYIISKKHCFNITLE